MGDGEDGAGVRRQVLLEPLHALGVEVVGRLVEQQQGRLLEQQLAQRDPAPLTTARACRRARPAAGSAARPSPGRAGSRGPTRWHGRGRSAGRPSRRAACRSRRRGRPARPRSRCSGRACRLISPTASSTFSSTVLPSVSGGSCSRMPTVASGSMIASPLDGCFEPGHDLEQGRLARAVRPDDADLGAVEEGQGDVVEDDFVAVCFAHGAKVKT